MKTLLLVAVGALSGCSKDNPVAPQAAGVDYDCRSCLAGNYCPQFCTEKP